MEICQWCFDAVRSAQSLERLIGLAACFRADRGEPYQKTELFAEARKAWLSRYVSLGGDPAGLPDDLDGFLDTLSGLQAGGVCLSDFSAGEPIASTTEPVAAEAKRRPSRRKTRQSEVLFSIPKHVENYD